MFPIAGGGKVSPLCEGIGNHSQGLFGPEDICILAINLTMEEHASSVLKTDSSACRWTLDEPRRTRVSPEDAEDIPWPKRTLGRRTPLSGVRRC